MPETHKKGSRLIEICPPCGTNINFVAGVHKFVRRQFPVAPSSLVYHLYHFLCRGGSIHRVGEHHCFLKLTQSRDIFPSSQFSLKTHCGTVRMIFLENPRQGENDNVWRLGECIARHSPRYRDTVGIGIQYALCKSKPYWGNWGCRPVPPAAW